MASAQSWPLCLAASGSSLGMIFPGLGCQARKEGGWGWVATSQTLASRASQPLSQLTNISQMDVELTCPELSQALLTPRPSAIPFLCLLQLSEAVGRGFTRILTQSSDPTTSRHPSARPSGVCTLSWSPQHPRKPLPQATCPGMGANSSPVLTDCKAPFLPSSATGSCVAWGRSRPLCLSFLPCVFGAEPPLGPV